MKRPDRQLYIPPALRSAFSKECVDEIECTNDKHPSEAPDMQAYYSPEQHDSSQRSSADIFQRRGRFHSSSASSNPKHISDESCEDDYSSDFEDYCGYEPTNHFKTIKETIESNSDDHWKERGMRHANYAVGVELENYQTNTKVSNTILKEYTNYTGMQSQANQCLKSESKETQLNKGLFYNYDDSSISEIETVIDAYTIKGRVLTSTPYSDIDDEKVLEAAKYAPTEGNAMESTLFGQPAINTNINKRDDNFEFCCDSTSVKNQTTDNSEIIGGTYIPPPVPPSFYAARLPIIPRLPSQALSSYQLSGPRLVSPNNVSNWPIQQRYSRYVPVPSQLLCPGISSLRISNPSPYISSYIPPTPRHALSPCVQSATLCPPNLTRIHSPTPPPLLPQERFNLPHISQDYPPYLPRQSLNNLNLRTYKQDYPFFIPPPMPVSQLTDGRHQISIFNQQENVRSQAPLPSSFINKMASGGKFQPVTR